jgi:hypothetical protein
MHRDSVASSSLVSIGHNPLTQVLEVEFKNGDVGEHEGVPADLYRQFMESPSKGQFHHQHIRGVFPFKIVERRAGAPPR